MSTTRSFSLTLALGLALSLTACGGKKEEASGGGAAKAGEAGGKAGEAGGKAGEAGAAKAGGGNKAGVDFAAIKAKIDAAKTKEDIDAVFDSCMGAMMDLGIKGGVKEPDKDPDYRATCKIGLTRQRAKIVIADSTPEKMNTMCLSAAIQTEELAEEGGPEAAEMKQLLADVNKACGL
ncbi:MAG TPA: hypothetical protein VM734_16875 [Kofleriaceae bacterium]|nr:hypothetical protein [Kofleriaceae bacterium]